MPSYDQELGTSRCVCSCVCWVVLPCGEGPVAEHVTSGVAAYMWEEVAAWRVEEEEEERVVMMELEGVEEGGIVMDGEVMRLQVREDRRN